MGEKNNNTQEQKPRTSMLAIASLILGFLGFATLGISSIAGLALGILALFQIRYSKGKVGGRRLAILGTTVSGGLIFFTWLILVTLPHRRDFFFRKSCRDNLTQLGKTMLVYSEQNNGQYTQPDRWCDLLVKHANATGAMFHCKGVREENHSYTIYQNIDPNSPWLHTVKYYDPNGNSHYVKRTYYAMNSNCCPNSPPDTVLLFETKGGWNQFGGKELLMPEHHRDKGCNILFNDGHVEFVRKKRLGNLNWGDKHLGYKNGFLPAQE